MKVLVCGGRDFDDFFGFDLVMDRLKTELGITFIVAGDAAGADTMAISWAKRNGIPFQRHVAKWDEFGKVAGRRRNQEMLDEHPDIKAMVAFPGGKGTRDMIGRSIKAGLDIYDVRVKELQK